MIARFTKMHGCGNDFVVFDQRMTALDLTSARAAGIADRRTGVGCDQLIVIEALAEGTGADAFMRIRNPDGGEAGACGNATRCVAHLLAAESGRDRLVIRTVAGDLAAEILADGQVRVDMGAARLGWSDVPLAREMDTLYLDLGGHLDLAAGPLAAPAACSMGNPHVTFFVADLAGVPISAIGPVLERHELFPDRANIGFVQMLAPDRLALRVWERGAGLTLACGSGACAALVNAHRRGLANRRATVIVDGGELEIEWRPDGPHPDGHGADGPHPDGHVADGPHPDGHVLMTGPVAVAFTGEIDLSAYPP